MRKAFAKFSIYPFILRMALPILDKFITRPFRRFASLVKIAQASIQTERENESGGSGIVGNSDGVWSYAK